MQSENLKSEAEEIKNRFERRKNLPKSHYSILNPDVYLRKQEFERTLIKWINWKGYNDLYDKKLLEIGCGNGINLLKFIELGFNPKNLIGNDIVTERAESAKIILPGDTKIIEGNALDLSFQNDSFDMILQFTVFTSILNPEFQNLLAKKIWTFAKPGGGILWYDFIYNNPKNKDVMGIPLKRIAELFPEGKIKFWRLTLAPPISRIVTKIHPSLYSILNILPFLRTHVLCWIEK